QMREDKHRRRFRNHAVLSGSSLIRKEPVAFDSCYIWMFHYQWGHVRSDWEKGLVNQETAGLFRPDPFGINDYFVDYSVNKKKRWTTTAEIAGRIEEVQDPRLSVRVSSSVQIKDRSHADRYVGYNRLRELTCSEYHSVSRDGKTVTHRKSNGRSRLRNFTHPKPQTNRKVKGKRRQMKFREEYEWENREVSFDDKLKYQLLNIHYTTTELTDRTSMYNKTTNRRAEGERMRVMQKDSWLHYRDDKKYDFTNRGLKRSMIRRPAWPKILADPLYDEDKGLCRCTYHDHEEYYEKDWGDDEEIDEDSRHFTTIVDDLSEFLVATRREKTRKRRAPRNRFVDEVLKPAFSPATSDKVVEEKDLEVAEMPSTSSSIQLVGLPSEMFTRIPSSSLPHLSSLPRLPCFPPSWEIHERDTLSVLGRFIASCVIARQVANELRLTIIDCCPSSSHPRLPLVDERPPHILAASNDCCEICYCDMDEESDDRLSHPFSLSCSHLFCTGCWLSHISQSIHRLKLPAACLDPDCPCTVSISAARGLLTASSLELYESSTIAALKKADKIVECPDCKKLHYIDGSLHLSCSCGTSICAHCSSVDHSPLGCDAFEQYNSYMHSSGFSSIHSSAAGAPIVRDLVRCPVCTSLMQKSEGCNHLVCHCGAEFCFACGRKWTTSVHYDCSEGASALAKVTLIDISKEKGDGLLVPSLLMLSVEARTLLLERRTEMKIRLAILPVGKRKSIERIIIKLSHIVELCYLNSRRKRSSRNTAEKIKFALDAFFHTKDKDLESKILALEGLHNSIIVR
ncbi:hypothetical protein PFISCL1PPCAC_22909, partial [Pristionchus fissidentatus]